MTRNGGRIFGVIFANRTRLFWRRRTARLARRRRSTGLTSRTRRWRLVAASIARTLSTKERADLARESLGRFGRLCDKVRIKRVVQRRRNVGARVAGLIALTAAGAPPRAARRRHGGDVAAPPVAACSRIDKTGGPPHKNDDWTSRRGRRGMGQFFLCTCICKTPFDLNTLSTIHIG